MLSIILTASVAYPNLDSRVILVVLGGGSALTVLIWLVSTFRRRGKLEAIDRSGQATWRMPPVSDLAPPSMTTLEKAWMGVLRGYLVFAGGLVLVRIGQLVLSHHG
jgi:hypothetical protein